MNCDEEIVFFLITLSREIKFMFISFNLSNLDFLNADIHLSLLRFLFSPLDKNEGSEE